MLNRRGLRIKAMQAIYAYEQCRQSNYHLAIDHIHAKFELDWNVTESKSTQQIKSERESAVQIFKDNYQSDVVRTDAEVPNLVRQSAVSGLSFYKKAVIKDFERLREDVMLRAEEVYTQYLSMLRLFIELSDYADTDFIERQKRHLGGDVVFEHERKFAQNFVAQRLREHENLQNLFRRNSISWNKNTVIAWYKLLRKDETFAQYYHAAQVNQVQEYELANYVCRQFILKNDAVVSYFEEQNLYWTEDKTTLKSMLMRTIRTIGEAEEGEESDLQPLSKNWEVDKAFLRDLYVHTIRNESEYAQLVSEKLQNWSIERITQVDRIVLKMAITEMVHFPSIPVKASINEYIEVVKNYSTDRSTEFINGVLDSLAIDLTKKGKIKKSGRGLLDNK